MADTQVKAQYEAYPYPERNPRDEAKGLRIVSPSQLFQLNHFVFGGRRDLTKPLQVLVAGGGTGDAAIMLAQQMTDAGVPGKIVHLDLSAASQKIAQERAKVRWLGNIAFVQGSLLEVGELGLGPFDYIDCCGVLHHLDDPVAGLNALVSVLAPDGGRASWCMAKSAGSASIRYRRCCANSRRLTTRRRRGSPPPNGC
jgi:ubiquinone/menaquinone biosynthesis C-methylase UbiE